MTKYTSYITASSVPVYGWLWDYWDSSDWVLWHGKLVELHGLAQANNIFIDAWNKKGFLYAHVSFRNSAFGANDSFIAYAQKNEFYDRLFAGFFGSLFKVQSAVVSGTQDLAGAVATVASSTKKWSEYLIPIIVLLAVGFVLLNFKTISSFFKRSLS